MTKNLKLLTIFCLLLLFCLGSTKIVKANSHPTMTTNQAQLIIDIIKNKSNYNELGPYATNMSVNEIHTMLENITPTMLANDFNTKASNLTYDFEWQDVTIIYGYGLSGNASKGFSIYYVIAPNIYTNFQFTNIYSNQKAYFYVATPYKYITTQIFMSDYSIYSGANNGNDIYRYPKFASVSTSNGTITNFTNLFIGVQNDRHVKYQNYGDYTLPYDLVYFTDNGGTGNDPVSGDTDSSLGYYFYDGIENVKQINLFSLSSYQTLNEWWYIGNDLTFDYDYYYINNNQKVSVKDYVDVIQSSNSGDTGKFYFPRINRQQLDNLPNNTGFYLDLSVNSGDIILADQWYSFVTYQSYVDSGSTGTITNTSGDVTGNIDLTGVQAGLQDLNNNLTNSDPANIDLSGDSDFLFNNDFQVEDPSLNFFSWILTQIQNIFLSNYTRESINVTFKNENITIYSDFFVMPDNALKTFLQAYYYFQVGYFIIKDIRKIVEQLKNGNIEQISTDDINANMV